MQQNSKILPPEYQEKLQDSEYIYIRMNTKNAHNHRAITATVCLQNTALSPTHQSKTLPKIYFNQPIEPRQPATVLILCIILFTWLVTTHRHYLIFKNILLKTDHLPKNSCSLDHTNSV